MITAVIPYTGNREGLTALLVGLQPQLTTNDDIYIIDSSADRSGLKIAALYATTRSFVFVEVAKPGLDLDTAENAGIQSMAENKQEGVLILSENTVISQTFIANLKKATTRGIFDVLIPKIIQTPYFKMDSNFQWFNPPTTEVKDMDPKEMVGGCYYINKNGLAIMDGTVKSPISIGRFENETVIILPYKASSSAA
jgi:hypothetical protein